MYRYTTPTLPITLSGIDFSDVIVFRIKIKQGSLELLKEIQAGDPNIDAQNNKIYVPLTQEETASFKGGPVKIQARVKFNNNAVMASNMVSHNMNDVLDEVII